MTEAPSRLVDRPVLSGTSSSRPAGLRVACQAMLTSSQEADDVGSPPELLTIGDVSGLAGRMASSIRYYGRIAFIPAPARFSRSGWLAVAVACACRSLDDCPLFGEPGRLPSPGAMAAAKPTAGADPLPG
jgi:hypothetical protein